MPRSPADFGLSIGDGFGNTGRTNQSRSQRARYRQDLVAYFNRDPRLRWVYVTDVAACFGAYRKAGRLAARQCGASGWTSPTCAGPALLDRLPTQVEDEAQDFDGYWFDVAGLFQRDGADVLWLDDPSQNLQGIAALDLQAQGFVGYRSPSASPASSPPCRSCHSPAPTTCRAAGAPGINLFPGPIDGREPGIGYHLGDEVPRVAPLLPLAQAGVLVLGQEHRDGLAAARDVHGLAPFRLVDEARQLRFGLGDRYFGHLRSLLTIFGPADVCCHPHRGFPIRDQCRAACGYNERNCSWPSPRTLVGDAP